MTQVKICGNANPGDAKLAAELGADYLGLIFTESKRKVSTDQAKAIMQALPEFSKFVGVFCNQPKKEVEDIVRETGIRIIQFHGDETARYCASFVEAGYEVIKTFRIKDERSIKRIDEYDVSAFLFDTYSKEEKGGTGVPFDWNLIANRPHVNEKLFLAGGLNIDNLEAAIKKVNPFAVDVASGVEKSPGVKDPDLLEKFIYLAKKGKREDAPKGLIRS